MVSAAIGVGIGLAFTYFVFASFCSGVNELIARVLNSRGKALFVAVNAFIGSAEDAARFWGHDLIKALSAAKSTPSGLLDIKKRSAPAALPVQPEDVYAPAKRGKSKIKSDYKNVLPSYISPATFTAVWADINELDPADDETKVALSALERSFSDAMDRLSGLYKRYIQIILLGLSVVAVGAFNIDTIHIARALWSQPALEATISSNAQSVLTTTTTATNTGATGTTGTSAVATALTEAENLPIGWGSDNIPHGNQGSSGLQQWLLKVLGLLLSIGAITLGAPFWFDVLGRLNSLRSTGPPSTT